MDIKLKIKLGEEGFWFFGPGVSELLDNIEEYGSVASASANMGLSYSKAWKIIRDSEKGLGCTLVERSTGGKGGGRALVTDKGKKINLLFKKLELDTENYCKERLRELEEKSWKKDGGTIEK